MVGSQYNMRNCRKELRVIESESLRINVLKENLVYNKTPYIDFSDTVSLIIIGIYPNRTRYRYSIVHSNGIVEMLPSVVDLPKILWIVSALYRCLVTQNCVQIPRINHFYRRDTPHQGNESLSLCTFSW